MAETIDLKEKASSNLGRIFNRVDSVELTPALLYEANGVEEADQATFTAKAADPVTRDELKQVVSSFTQIQAQVCEMHGVSMQMLTGDFPKLAKNASKQKRKDHMQMLEAVAISLQQIKVATESVMSSAETRNFLARCITSITNYKELKGTELVESKKSVAEILQDIPSIICIWLFEEIQKLSNLTAEEVLGL